MSAPYSGGDDRPPSFPEPGERLFPDVPVWFERFGDIPGLGIELEEVPGRMQLLGCKERPWVYVINDRSTGQDFRHLQWPGSPGFGEWTPNEYGHTWSPAARLFFGVEQRADRSVDQIVADLMLALERPGTGVDYHFLLQGAVEELWKLREADSTARAALINVALMDRRLVTVVPDTLTIAPDKPGQYLRSGSLERLAATYELIGDLEAAFDVTTFALQFGQLDSRHRRLAKKLDRAVDPRAKTS